MNNPDSSTLVTEAQRLSGLELPALFATAQSEHVELFPSDWLYGESPEGRYREWIRRQLMPKLAEMGKEGERWWQIITRVDLFDHPEELTQVLAVLSMWFLPDHEKYFAAIALLVIIRRLGDGLKK